MLSKHQRLTKENVAFVMQKGKRINSELFYLRVFYKNDIPNPQFAVIVPKKVNKRSTVRNTIKRKFRAAIYTLDKQNFFKPGFYSFYILSDDLKIRKSNEIEEVIKAML